MCLTPTLADGSGGPILDAGSHGADWPTGPNSDETAGQTCATCTCRYGDWTREVSVNALKEYYIKSDYQGANIQDIKKFKLSLFMASKDEVRVLIRLKTNMADIDDAVAWGGKTKGQVINDYLAYQCKRITEIWSNRYLIKVNRKECPPRYLKVFFDLEYGPEIIDPHQNLRVLDRPVPSKTAGNPVSERSNVKRSVVTIFHVESFYKEEPDLDSNNRYQFENGLMKMKYSRNQYDYIVFPHEYGHMFGLPDEYYIDTNLPSFILTLIPPKGQQGDAAQNTFQFPKVRTENKDIMGEMVTQLTKETDIGVVEKWHYYGVAIELEKLLQLKYPDDKITCEVVGNSEGAGVNK